MSAPEAPHVKFKISMFLLVPFELTFVCVPFEELLSDVESLGYASVVSFVLGVPDLLVEDGGLVVVLMVNGATDFCFV